MFSTLSRKVALETRTVVAQSLLRVRAASPFPIQVCFHQANLAVGSCEYSFVSRWPRKEARRLNEIFKAPAGARGERGGGGRERKSRDERVNEWFETTHTAEGKSDDERRRARWREQMMGGGCEKSERIVRLRQTKRRFVLRHLSSSGTAHDKLVVFLSRTKAGVIFVIFCKKQKFHEL